MRTLTRLLALATLLALPLQALAVSPPPVQAESGLVAADNARASQAGAAILEAGGSAADAAVATALALGVVSPGASGLGGGGFALYYDQATEAVVVLDFREVAPAGATAELFFEDGAPLSVDVSRFTGRAIGVPGEVAGLYELHRRYGRLPWARVCEPALALATDGFTVSHHLAETLARYRDELLARPLLATDWLTASGEPAQFGDVVRRPALAGTLRRLAESGPEAFYAGPVAEAIVSAAQTAGSTMTLEDLAGYTVVEREPVEGDYRGYHLYGMPPPSSGATTLVAALEVLEGYDLAALGHNSSAYLHLLAEALQFAYAERAVAIGDPAFVDIDVAALIDPALGERRRALIDPEHTLPPDAYGPGPAAPSDGGTSHLCAVDSERNVVALTTTVNYGFGAMVVAGETGVVLNNELNDFDADPHRPGPGGALLLAANAPRGGARPMSSMSPTLVFRDGQPYLILGGSGGPAIITGVLQVLLNVLDFDLTIREAIDAPRIHHQWLPPILFAEPGIPADVRQNLVARGHVVADPPWVPSVQGIVLEEDVLYGASDPRKAGEPAGY